MATIREDVEADGQFSFENFIQNNLVEILGIIVDNDTSGLVQGAVRAVLARVKEEHKSE